MVDVFRQDMPLPLVGIGHSFGAAQLVALAQIHPRLFYNLVLLDPLIAPIPSRNAVALAKSTAFQKDLWSSREEAEAAIRANPFYKRWNVRVLERYLKLLFRETPTTIYPDVPSGKVTKRTTKHQEFLTTFRPNFENVSRRGRPATVDERRMHPDVDNQAPFWAPFTQVAGRQAFSMLPTLRPAVHFILGEKSPGSWPELRKARLESCGTGPGGSGGAEIGRVKETLLPSGHFLPFDLVSETSKAVSEYLGKEMKDWKEAETKRLERWGKLTIKEKQTMDTEVFKELDKLDKKTEKYVKSLSSKI